MLAKVYSAAVFGINAIGVQVEADLAGGLPSFTVVGLPDAAVRESRERVASALRNSGYQYPARRITINLAPAGIRKEGALYDLPIALGLLLSSEQIDSVPVERTTVVGELSLDGRLRPIRGVLSMALRARSDGHRAIVVPRENADEAANVSGLEVWPAESLTEAVEKLRFPDGLLPHSAEAAPDLRSGRFDLDFADVRGQETAKRALEIAAAGGHNLLLLGPPGSGKTMLARRLPSILPPLSRDEAIEVTQLYSVSALLASGSSLIQARPFRAPHHTTSDAGMAGGGTSPRPGEISLAHHGVLFLDEMPEFRKNVVELLRQPMEEGQIAISRSAGTVVFPAKFMLVAAMNPCPCGYAGEPRCMCDPAMIARYAGKLSGPLLDRIDIHVEVPRVPYKELAGVSTGDKSATIRERVIRARTVQHDRFAAAGNGSLTRSCNARLEPAEVRVHCTPTKEGAELLRMAMEKLELSARAHDRALRVARTIADLAGAGEISAEHMAEAIQYRSLDRPRWRGE